MSLLIHYSKQPVRRIRSISQQKEPDMKPKGLWVSVEDGWGWKDWCTAEQWGLDRLSCEHVVSLHPDAAILRLASVDDIDRFHRQFSVLDAEPYMRRWSIDWAKVAQDWQGIIIAPYQWQRRLHMETAWYYGWDCSSGCIWDARAIASIALKTSVETA